MKTSTMKNVIMGSVLAVAAISSLSANAAEVTICAGGGAKDGAAVTAGTDFVKVAFTPKCSANVILSGDDVSATVYKVGAASVKGKTVFAGSSLGGAVGNVGTCGASPCTPGEITTGMGTLPGS
ncbi:hypothetical protein [Candidatus Accumulibacter sp. ACC003]|jgi:hypothetical protein|uniref:hypothetical protein n=1 Tax=Candidatus Accumulibacter sp. ACC003 TaxID=2823334 RepID=UPI0025BD1EC6|nr:hypothetical protein [Candidatus Accumulibacter sp. ACC003]